VLFIEFITSNYFNIMEKLLSREEIIVIEKEAQNPWYRLKNLVIIPEDYKSINSVTPKGLIFINGNNDTGLTHINERHRHSNGNYKLTKGKVTNPSLFDLKSCSLLDYEKIVDEVYLNNEKIVKGLFDEYKGYFGGELYNLILYKDSRIVHTLYPQKKIFNSSKRQLIKYVIGKMNATHNIFDNDAYTVSISYIDCNQIDKYIFKFRLIPKYNLEELWIEILNNKEHHDVALFIYSKDLNVQDGKYPDYLKRIFTSFELGKVEILEKLIEKIERRGLSQFSIIVNELFKLSK